MSDTTPIPPASEREMFEAWVLDTYNYGYSLTRSSEVEGAYVHDGTDMAWDAWQARAALSHPSPQGWEGVESAPRDGTPVFAFWPPSGIFPVHGGCYGVAAFQEGRWCNPEDSDDYYVEPSYWQPLPPPPEQGSKG